jgi:hypothetical protein
MANLTLSQLRAAQAANPPVVNDDGAPPAAPAGLAPEGSLPLQASPTVSAGAAGGGFTRIFPPTFPTAAQLPDDWKAQNWVGNGPWQHLEGQPMHPEFEHSLALLERAVCE